MLDDFLTRAVIAGAGVALAAGPLGCFVVWRRMAYFGDATAHAAIMGVALALAFSLPIGLGTLIVALVMAVLVARLTGRGFATDTALGVISHAALAVGLVAASLIPGQRLDLQAFLFGDILAVSAPEVLWIWAGALGVVGLLVWRWQRLVTATVNEELAMSAGIDPERERLILAIALAVVVAVAIRIVGALLISALLIIPAAAARSISPTPERMAAVATGLALISVAGGLWGSFVVDTPTGPSIVVAATVIFAAFSAIPKR
ncbi:MAG: hypothetical protein DI498_12210 [Paracoccus denitrificans]|nr:MAG: hypothetical protein DI498_12210 [Paracoccus denitrificans]PZO83384.1 MAG: hypothetical protein DI633_12210 [Paracoccus denitrificans]